MRSVSHASASARSDQTAPAAPMPSTPTPRRRAARTAGRRPAPWPSWLPRCAGRRSPGPGLPREEGRRVLEDAALPLQAPHALSELAQLLALGAGQPHAYRGAFAASAQDSAIAREFHRGPSRPTYRPPRNFNIVADISRTSRALLLSRV